MLEKICGLILFTFVAMLTTATMCIWWQAYGVHEAYPYLMTIIAGISWWLVYNIATKKED